MKELLLRNSEWAAERIAQDPDYFKRLAGIQRPHYFWIGCSDSRVPANVIAQVSRVAETPIVQDAWSRGQRLLIHGLCYGLKDGRLRNLGCTLPQPRE